jgi:hypothetical protein
VKLIDKILETRVDKTEEEIAYIMNESCPIHYDGLGKRYFPYKASKKYKDDCEYRYMNNQSECDKCWNREYEEPPKSDWEELREMCQKWIKESGLTKEESRKILEEVRNSLRD